MNEFIHNQKILALILCVVFVVISLFGLYVSIDLKKYNSAILFLLFSVLFIRYFLSFI